MVYYFSTTLFSLYLQVKALPYMVDDPIVAVNSRLNETCGWLDAARDCEDNCLDKMYDCENQCGDEACKTQCRRDVSICFDSCPCHELCPLGCEDCENEFCKSCMYPENDSSRQTCLEVVERIYNRCITVCGYTGSDDECIKTCDEEQVTNIDVCPCSPGCSDGCPCPDYDCVGSVPYNNQTILVIHTKEETSKPVIMMDPNGYTYNTNFFTIEPRTGAYHSCSALLYGQMFIFGGGTESIVRQVSIVRNCGLRRVGDLSYDFAFGGCNTFKTAQGLQEVLMCFQADNGKGCHRFDGKDFTKAPTAVSDHFETSLANYNNGAFIIGGTTNRKMEFLEKSYWTNKGLFPLTQETISGYSVVNFGKDLYLFGKFENF